MKKTIVLIGTIFLIGFCKNDKSPLKPSLDEGFAIYTLADSALTAIAAAQQSINSLILQDEPIITDQNREFYKWSEHTLRLKSEANERIKKLAISRATVFGIPFIVMAMKERIYLGGFWYAFSSVAPSFPTIEVTNYMLKDYRSTFLKIEKSWIENQPGLRNDARIYRAIKEAGVLIP